MSEWKPMETAPRDGTLVALVWHDWSGVVAARFGVSIPSKDVGWFQADWEDTLSDLVPDFPENMKCTDQSFAGWVRLPEMKAVAAPHTGNPYTCNPHRR